MKTWYMNKSITTKIALVFILLNFLIVGFFTAVLYYYFQQITRESVEDALNSTIMANDSKIREILKRIEISIDLVHDSGAIYSSDDPGLSSISEMIVSFQEMDNNGHLIRFLNDYKTNTRLFNNYFKTCFGEEGSEYSNIFFINTSWPIAGHLRKLSDCVGDQGFSSALKIEDTEWYQRASAMAGEPYWFIEGEYLCMAKALKYQYMLSSMEVRDYELGVIVAGFPISLLSEQLDMNALTYDSEVFLVDSSNSVIYSTDKEEIGTVSKQSLGESEQGKIQEVLYEGERCLVNQSSLPLGVRILTVVPLQDVYQIASRTIRVIEVAGLLTVVLAVILTLVLSWGIVTPLKEFANYMEEGDTDIFPFDIDRRDEVGVLYKSFNHLLSQLKDTMYRELKAQEDRARAEFCALQVQINPHYIYNTLNSISCLSLLKGQDDIAELISNLTKVIRYNINDPTALVPVSRELDMIRQYENIQKSCYQNRIFFEYDVVPELENFMIPKLIIQPLMENTIFHGMDPKEKILKVLLKICIEDDYLVISVKDNGKNADTDKINLYVTGQIESKSNSLGVHNIYERLQIIYGKESALHYQKDENGNTVAIIRIPYLGERRKG